jgi:glycosyltransferase involved in cell wall biosynthesis
MINIAITANTSWYIYNFRINTIRALLKKNFNIFIISPYDSYTENLKKEGCKFIPINIDRGGTNPSKDFFTFISFCKIYKDNTFDCILNFTPKNNIYSTLAARVFKINTINNISGLGFLFSNKKLSSLVARFLYKISQTHARTVFFQNKHDMELFIGKGFVKKENVILINGSGVDLERFVYHESVNDGVIRFLLSARMLYEKGVQHFVEAADQLKKRHGESIEFNLLGFIDKDNPSAISENTINNWVKNGSINYLGVTDSVEDIIKNVDCVVLPSYYREGIPKSLIEAGAMGKPIITTDSIGCRNTVDPDINGYLCEPKSTISLIEQIEKIIKMPRDELILMGKSSRLKMQNEFDERIIINKYLSQINMFLKEANTHD